MNGSVEIKTCLDLGFPHDVIRIAGGFATGVYVKWNASIPIIPVDTCVNVCSCSFFEINNDIIDIFNNSTFLQLNENLKQGIYISNFHRGNHFISYIQSVKNGKRYLLLHSSASEFKSNYNGLYPIKGNWFYDQIKTYCDRNSYIRYIEGKDAEVFYSLSENLVSFNETRHEFIAQLLLRNKSSILGVSHFHHYFMPSNNSVVMGSHILSGGQKAPILSVPGANIYMVNFEKAKVDELYIDDSHFLTPHGWGKRHKQTPEIEINAAAQTFRLDNIDYKIEFGESLRSHPALELRNYLTTSKNENSFFDYLNQNYKYKITDEFKQIASYNKAGVVIW